MVPSMDGRTIRCGGIAGIMRAFDGLAELGASACDFVGGRFWLETSGFSLNSQQLRDLKCACPKACNACGACDAAPSGPSAGPVDDGGFAVGDLLQKLVPGKSGVQRGDLSGRGGICWCPGEDRAAGVAVGSYNWDKYPEVACHGGSVTSYLDDDAEERVGVRRVCDGTAVPPEAYVNDNNRCYLAPPTEAQFPGTFEERRALWRDRVDLFGEAMSWTSKATQFRYESDARWEDCAGNPLLGGVVGSGFSRSTQLGDPVSCASHRVSTTVRTRSSGAGDLCDVYKDDLAETPLFQVSRRKTQAPYCANSAAIQMASFLVIGGACSRAARTWSAVAKRRVPANPLFAQTRRPDQPERGLERRRGCKHRGERGRAQLLQ
jgi:hypothetical protein